jgi:2-methylcitrate dehydratase PrpD
VSRNEGKIRGEGDAPVDAADILAALAREAGVSAARRNGAVSRYLSASDGWREASTLLGGAFAAEDQDYRPRRNRDR